LGCFWNLLCVADVFRFLDRCVAQSGRVLAICCAALLWTVLNIRNKFTIERIFQSHPADALYKISMYCSVEGSG
jgi:hypothetical protein